MQLSFAILIPSNHGDCITGIDQWVGEKWWGNFIFLINELVMGNLWLLVTFVKSMAFFWENMAQSCHIVRKKNKIEFAMFRQ
jgi:hypothetical protein